MEQRTRRVLAREIWAIRINLQTPRKSRRLTEKLLIKPVTPTTKRLRQNNTRRHSIRKRREIHVVTAARIPGTKSAHRNRAHNTDTALPDL